MTAARWGIFLVSLGVIAPRLFGGDAPAASEVAGSQDPSGPAATAEPLSEESAFKNLSVTPGRLIGEGSNGRERSSSKVRRVILESFPYVPPAREKAAEDSSPILVRAQPAPVDADVVVLSKLEVTASAYERHLPAAMAAYRDPRPRNTTRFGTGVRQKDFGKVRASVTTILYVPVFFGLSW
jgi:hypothetical protein